ncbi:MAG: nitroreductase family protein [Oscillospiraceae bacterium]|nr:nitroreductase family protein [Oscillospiraceae bacterium]
MELKEAVWTRRSVRKFDPTPIEHEVLEEILQGALMAPSAVNLQPWHFVVLESAEAVEEYRAIMREGAKGFLPTLEKRFPDHPEVVEETMSFLSSCGGAPVVVLAFLNKPAFNERRKSSSHVQSVAAAIQNLVLLAWDKGISSCWTGAPLSAGVDGEIEARFAPEHGDFVAAICMGYSQLTPKAPRRKTDRVVFL